MKIQLLEKQNQSEFENLPNSVNANCSFSIEAGFSLIELLAAITIFTVCLGAAYGLLEVARASRSTVNQQVQTMQAARSALNAMGRDFLNVGSGDFRQSGNGALLKNGALRDLLGAPFQAADSDFMPTILPGDNRNSNSLSGIKTDQVTLMYQDISFNANQSLRVDQFGVAVGGDVVSVVSGTPDLKVNNLIVLSGSSTSAIGMVTRVDNAHSALFEDNDLLGLNSVGRPGPIAQIRGQQASFTRVVLLTYRVLSNGTLVRTVYGNNPSGTTRASQIQDAPLVQNVENMQIEYILEDGTETSDPTVLNPETTPTQLYLGQAAARMQHVRQIRLTLTLRSSQTDVRNNQPLKLVLNSTFSTRNMTYDRS